VSETEVLVVGAGPTGLTLAVDLARRGVAVRVIERDAAPNRASKAKGIQSRSLEVLDDLGAVEHVLRHGVADLPVRYHEPSGAVVDRPSIVVRARDSFHTPYPDALWIGQFDVEHALRQRLRELGATVDHDAEAVGLTQDEDGVTVTLRDGEVVRARYVVGADGGRSAIRGLVGLHLTGDTDDTQRWYVGDVTAPGLDRDHLHIWPSDTGMLALTPLPNSHRFQLQTPVPAADQPAEPSLERYQRLLAERGASVELTSASWLSLFRVNVRMVDTYRRGRVLLAGDAAHVHSPAGGQGMNTGIQDAYNLGWKLGAVVQGATPDLLDTYGAERIPVARRVLALSTAKITRTEQAGHGTAELSQALSELADDAVTTGLGIRYHSSAAASATAGPAVGHRAPNATGLQGPDFRGDLFDLLRGPQWSLIAFDTNAPTIADHLDPARVRVLRIGSTAGSDVVDARGEFRERYAPQPGELILVRPDGHLAARGPRIRVADLFDQVVVRALTP
jgi:2-polyprenyl-6-methoxyphenol hydroxylase-like FAD-dependent oxidoreductase